jgi:predicted transcriptional regulator
MKKSSRAKKASQAKQESQSVVVTVSSDRHIHEVARDLKASGLESAQVLDAINIVTGSVAPKSIEKLRKVRGVQDVSEDHPVSIGPPGAPIS